jgi:hypothetical protein
MFEQPHSQRRPWMAARRFEEHSAAIFQVAGAGQDEPFVACKFLADLVVRDHNRRLTNAFLA